MCLKKATEKVKNFYKKDRQTFIVLAIIAIVGIALRLFFINATDISGDEVFFVTYAYKIAYLLASAPIVTIGLAAIAIVSVYLIAVRKNLKATILIAAILLAAKFGLGIPYLTEAPPPFFVIVTAGTIFLTGLTANIAGELVSTTAMIGLAFVGFFWASKWNKKAGILAFALLMFSPYNIFMSSTSFIGPLGWFLAFASLALFFEGQKNPKLLPIAGILAAFAFATRFPTLIILPFFVGISLLNRKKLLKQENIKNTSIFFVLVFVALIFFTPLLLQQFEVATSWLEKEGIERWDLAEAHLSAPIAEVAKTDGLPSEDPWFLLKIMNFFYSPLFILLLAFALPFSAYRAFKSRNYELASLLLIGVGLFASSVSKNQIVGFLLAMLIGIFFHIIFGILAGSTSGLLGNVFNYLSLSTHFESISRGVIDSKDLIYFFSVMALGLLGAEYSLTRRKF